MNINNLKQSCCKARQGKSALAFTLAEVLITLGIIGVVAAMTIPTLVNSYQRQEYITALKRSYAILPQGLKQYMANEGASELNDTDMFDGTAFSSGAKQDKIDTAIRKYFKVTKSCKYGSYECKVMRKYLNASGTAPIFQAPSYTFCTIDGACYELNLNDACSPTDLSSLGGMKAYCGYVQMDTNGEGPPNQFGRDVFGFNLGHDGSIYPVGGIDYAKFYEGANWANSSWAYWKKDPTNGCGTAGNADVSGTLGFDCAARIQEEGWKMAY